MAILSQQTFTVRRLIDGKTLNFLLQSNQALTQIFTPDPATYTPNYTASPYLVITPSLLISGEANDQIAQLKQAPTWKINGSTNLSAFTATTGASSPYALTIKKNMSDVAQMTITCEAIYVQPVTLVEMPITATITFTKTSNNGASIIAVCTAPQGTIFKNGLVSTLQAKCELHRGAVVDTTDVTYEWYKQVSGTWTKITSANAGGITNYTTGTITIPASAVVNYGSFRCDIKDTDSGSSTNNKVVSDYISFVDMSDPYEIDVVFPTGDGVKSGVSIKIKVECRQGATRLDSTFFTGKTIKVYRFNAAGALDTTWGTSGYKTLDATRELTIADADLLTGAAQTSFGVQLEG
ncbi:MAG: hypothetical protein BGO29_07520 [Bacteroidales bacterium 36-12]|nr:MAG: hypothetical protein BGO29_07520 [Bacteroidales bacterium 36-12]